MDIKDHLTRIDNVRKLLVNLAKVSTVHEALIDAEASIDMAHSLLMAQIVTAAAIARSRTCDTVAIVSLKDLITCAELLKRPALNAMAINKTGFTGGKWNHTPSSYFLYHSVCSDNALAYLDLLRQALSGSLENAYLADRLLLKYNNKQEG